MTCTNELTDEQISAVLDGAIDPDVQRHLEQCPDCAQRVEAARHLETWLDRRLYRWNCPPAQMLTDFHFDLLMSQERQAVAEHVDFCSLCQDELAQLRVFLKTEAVARRAQPVRAKPGLRDLIAQFVPMTPQRVMRGPSRGNQPVLRKSMSEPLLFEADGINIFLETEATPQGFALRGLIVAELDDLARWHRALVELWQLDQVQSVAEVDESGGFRLPTLNTGSLELRIIIPEGRRLIVSKVIFEDD